MSFKKWSYSKTALLTTASTSTGIYHHHLQRHWVTLQEQPELANLIQSIVSASDFARVNPILLLATSALFFFRSFQAQTYWIAVPLGRLQDCADFRSFIINLDFIDRKLATSQSQVSHFSGSNSVISRV